MRQRLPDERPGLTQKFTIISNRPGRGDEPSKLVEVSGYIQISEYPDTKKLGEVFLKIGKAGAMEAAYDGWAMEASLALQYGATLKEVFGKVRGMRFAPSGAVIGINGVTQCTSLYDLVARYLFIKYGTKEEQSDEPTTNL